eukprot:TRINITY_DN62256_c0_g1_i2.p1 TRINITY_DN62256_c0_g1~~TRINITY_DN62256_c0_g1_i2.p1  ORF type:complete len:310 (+),score=33.59 TRINITY_DN62256_c0_g1_i2:374-1303(+)
MEHWAYQRQQAQIRQKEMLENKRKEWALAQGLDLDDPNAVPVIKLGDASIASPFTSKFGSTMAVAHIARLGRCTLVTTLQMYKILALNCLISAYSMSVLYSDGVKFGDKQMMVTGVVIALCFLFISRSKPLEKLSPERPETRVFSVYMMLSILGQFGIHLYFLISAVNVVFGYDPELAGKKVSEEELEADFKPTLMNSVVFLITTIQEVCTFANNYRGPPWMTGLRENKPLAYGLTALGVVIFTCASEAIPDFNEFLEIVPMPTPEFRNEVLKIMISDVLLVWGLERVLLFIFKDRPHRRMKKRKAKKQ